MIHIFEPVARLVATYPGPRPDPDASDDELAAFTDQVHAWLRRDHATEWETYCAGVARAWLTPRTDSYAASVGFVDVDRPPGGGEGPSLTTDSETAEVSPPNRENSSRDLLPHPRRP